MHILHVSPYYAPAYAYGGIPRIVEGLSTELARQDHTISVLTTDAHDEELRGERILYQRDDGVHVFTAPNLSNRLAFTEQLYLPIVTRQYFEAIESRGPVDIIHLHGHRHLLNTIVVHWAKKKNIPYVFTANGTLRRHEQKEWIKLGWDIVVSGKVPFEAAQCIVVSEADKTIHMDWGVPESRLTQIPNCVDTIEFQRSHTSPDFKARHNIPHNAPIVAYLGRISPRKGVDKLVQAFSKLEDSAYLLIAGSDMGGLAQAKMLANNNPRILFLNTISGTERIDFLANANVVVYPSQREIFGLVPFESLLAGTPVVVSDDCGCGELIAQAESGLVVPYGHIELLAKRISELIYTPSKGRAMVDRGRRFIERYLSLEVVAQQHIDLYQQIVCP